MLCLLFTQKSCISKFCFRPIIEGTPTDCVGKWKYAGIINFKDYQSKIWIYEFMSWCNNNFRLILYRIVISVIIIPICIFLAQYNFRQNVWLWYPYIHTMRVCYAATFLCYYSHDRLQSNLEGQSAHEKQDKRCCLYNFTLQLITSCIKGAKVKFFRSVERHNTQHYIPLSSSIRP